MVAAEDVLEDAEATVVEAVEEVVEEAEVAVVAVVEVVVNEFFIDTQSY